MGVTSEGGGTEADAPSHFLLLSTFPVAQNWMGGIMPSQQSPFGPCFSLPEPHNGNWGPLSSVTSLFSGLTPNLGHQSFLGLSLSNTDSTW